MQTYGLSARLIAKRGLIVALAGGCLTLSVRASDLIVNSSGSTISISSGTTNYGNISLGETVPATANTLEILNSGTSVNASGDTLIGNNGASNNLSISGGAVLNGVVGYLGVATTSTTNSALITGAGSAWNTAAIYLGYNGGGNSLTISNGGMVTGTVGNTALGQFATSSNNTATVTGANSKWIVSSGAFITGYSGSGNSLTISNGGMVQIAANNLIGYLAGSAGNSVLVTGSNSTLSSAGISYAGYEGSGTLTVADGAQVTSSAFVAGSQTGSGGAIVVSGTDGHRGTLSGGSFTRGSGSGSLTVDGGILRATGDSTGFVSGFSSGNVTFASGGGRVDSNGYNITISSEVGGAGGLIKQGNGTLTVSASNSYMGETVVENGTLSVLGDQTAATGTTTVAGGATLSGNGTIGGDTVVQSGGMLLPGATFGTLTIKGSLTTDAGATVKMKFGGTAVHLFDQLDVQGQFVAAGTLDLEIDTGFTPNIGDTFTIFGGSTPGFDSGSFTITTNLSGGLFWDTASLASTGVVSVVPEPSSIVLLALGTIAVVVAARCFRTKEHEKGTPV